jgi:hypothetical protein
MKRSIRTIARIDFPQTGKITADFWHGQNTRAKGLVPLDGRGWITGVVPKPVAIQGRKALGVARRIPAQNTRAKGLVPLDGRGWITGVVPKPVAIQGRKALGVARRKLEHARPTAARMPAVAWAGITILRKGLRCAGSFDIFSKKPALWVSA